MPRHYDRAVAHLTAALGDSLTPHQIDRLARQCLESVTMFAVEAVCLPRLIHRNTWSRYIRLRDFDDTLRLLLSGQGLILVTGHYGSFELLGHLLANLGFEVAAVMRPLDNAYLNRFIVTSRRTHGLNLLDKKGATVQAEDLLRDGSLLGFIGDQDAGRKGLFVDFFGRPASTYKSIALLAVTTETPVVVGYARRCGHQALYEIGVKRIVRPNEWQNRHDPIRWITQEYTKAIEDVVREDPTQYLWIHRRWKSRPRLPRKPAESAAVALSPEAP
jgi:KDO2-lipid IV(A) lauroyltransferase